MAKTIDFAEQLAAGAAAAKETRVDGSLDKIIFCGVGGSKIPAEIISMLWLDGLNLYINRASGLPHWASNKNLVVCVSWSGNTEEPIYSLNEAIERKIPSLVISKDGEMEKIATANGLPFVKLPDGNGVPARFGIGYMLGAILTVFKNSAIIETSLDSRLNTNDLATIRGLSERLANKTPLIYCSYQWRFLGSFWKLNFNEDCKIHSFSNYFPEAAHNELAGFNQTNKGSYFPIILIDQNENRHDVEKLKKFSRFLKNQNIDHEIISIEGINRLEKILGNYNLAISTSVALASILGIEPFNTSAIEEFKKTK